MGESCLQEGLLTGLALGLQLSFKGGCLLPSTIFSTCLSKGYPRPFCKKESKPASRRAPKTEEMVLTCQSQKVLCVHCQPQSSEEGDAQGQEYQRQGPRGPTS